VQIGFEDLCLGVVSLHFPRGGLFAQFALDGRDAGAIRAVDQIRMHVAHELLRNGACAARMSAERVLDGAGETDDVHAVMLIETLILHGNERLTHILRQRAERYARPELLADLADERTVARQNDRRLRWLHDLPGLPGALRGERRRESWRERSSERRDDEQRARRDTRTAPIRSRAFQ